MITTSHTDREHARFSPSSAERWLNCPACVSRTEHLPRTDSLDSSVGSSAHELAEQCWRGGTKPDDYIGQMMPAGAVVDREMAGHIAEYLNIIAGLDNARLEVKLSIPEWPDCWGTADVVGEGPTFGGIFDLKYGVGEVSPFKNPALLTYAALARFDRKDDVELMIFQPRNGGLKIWATTGDRVAKHALAVEAAIKAANAPNPPAVAGPHCKWCPIRGTCPERLAWIQEQAQMDFGLVAPAPRDLPLAVSLTDAQLGKLLDLSPLLADLLKNAKEEALRRARAGASIPGYVLSEGRAGNREWTCTPAQLAAAVGDPDVVLTSEPELLSPAKIEAAIGKHRWKELGLSFLTSQEPGKVALLREKVAQKGVVEADFTDVTL